MFDLINGIPLHPLVVHAIVVLLPLATIGTLAIAVRAGWRRPYGPLVVAAAVVATVLCPVATESGEQLEHRVGDPGMHAELGDTLVWFALALAVTSALLVWVEHRTPSTSERRPLVTGLTILAVVASVAAGVQVYRVGDSGARAAWGDAAAASAPR